MTAGDHRTVAAFQVTGTVRDDRIPGPRRPGRVRVGLQVASLWPETAAAPDAAAAAAGAARRRRAGIHPLSTESFRSSRRPTVTAARRGGGHPSPEARTRANLGTRAGPFRTGPRTAPPSHRTCGARTRSTRCPPPWNVLSMSSSSQPAIYGRPLRLANMSQNKFWIIMPPHLINNNVYYYILGLNYWSPLYFSYFSFFTLLFSFTCLVL